MEIKTLLLFLCVFPTICYCRTEFYHLNRYRLDSVALKTYKVSDDRECLKKCANNDACRGVEITVIDGSLQCKLVHVIQDISPLAKGEQCGWYIKNVKTNVPNTQRDPLKYLVQNSLLASGKLCPVWPGFKIIDKGLHCYLEDNNYSFKFGSYLPIKKLSAGYAIPMKVKEWYCTNPIYTAIRNIKGTHYCYAVIPIWKTNERITARKAMDHCVQHSGTFASIHSEEENNVIAELGKHKRAIGVGIELIDNNGLRESSYRWTDGTPVDYTKFNNLERGHTYLFPFGAIFNDAKKWYTRWNRYEEFAQRLSSIACKTPALSKTVLKEIPANVG